MQQLVCHAFMKACGEKEMESLLSFLPPKDKSSFAKEKDLPAALCEGFDPADDLLQRVHYSWFSPFLRTLPEEEAGLFLSVFPEEEAKSLQQELLVSQEILPISPITKAFLEERLAAYLLKDQKTLLPVQALPPSSLHCLLELSTTGIRELADFLGLHDLAVEMKQIIDNTKLKKIYSLLSREKLLFLKSLSHNKEGVVFKKMGIVNWSGDPEALLSLLRKRGMNRLAKALYFENKDFVWHLIHKMSYDEAHLLMQLQKTLEHQKAHNLLGRQVIEVFSFFKTHNIKSIP